MQKPAGCMGHLGRRAHVSQAKHSVNVVGSWHSQIHDGQYQRKQLFEAARRSRACAYLADDDHSPLALQEILLACCPTVGVRTGASFVKSGETGVLVNRLPPGRQCVETEEDELALGAFLDAIEQAQTMHRQAVRHLAAEQFDSGSIVDQVVAALVKSLGPARVPGANSARGIETRR